MRRFGTQGPVNSKDNYVVARSEELADFINRLEQGRYIVLFAPRQTGKTTFFQDALKILTDEVADYFPIRLNFEEYEDITPTDFYGSVCKEICKEIQRGFRERVDASISTTILSASLQLMVSSEQMKMECVRSSTPSIYIEFCRHSSHL